jgi:hypothetical protein
VFSVVVLAIGVCALISLTAILGHALIEAGRSNGSFDGDGGSRSKATDIQLDRAEKGADKS